MRYCKNCGLLQTPDADRCPQCGAPLPPEPTAPAPGAVRYQDDGAGQETPGALSFGATLGILLLFSIPVAGFILMLVWSFGTTRHPARQTLAQACLVRTLIVAVIVAALMLLFALTAYFTVTPVRIY